MRRSEELIPAHAHRKRWRLTADCLLPRRLATDAAADDHRVDRVGSKRAIATYDRHRLPLERQGLRRSNDRLIEAEVFDLGAGIAAAGTLRPGAIFDRVMVII